MAQVENKTMPALVLTKAGHVLDFFKLERVPVPLPDKLTESGQVLVKLAATAINPVDWKFATIYGERIKKFPVVLGCDMAGTVAAVGPDVTSFKVGDRVCGYPGLLVGTFAAFCPINANLCFSIPEGMSFNQAATFGVGLLTAALMLFHFLKLDRPSKGSKTGEFVLVWGGASSVGTFCVQLAALAGYKPIAVASTRNHAKLKALGAAVCIDYHIGNEAVLKAIKEVTGDTPLRVAADVVGTKTANQCAKALTGTQGAHLVCVAKMPDELPKDVKCERAFLGFVPENPELTASVLAYIREFQPLLNRGCIRPLEVSVVDGGLANGVVKALVLSAEGKVSGSKLVVPL